MGVELLGYSERGVLNAICEDIHHSPQPHRSLMDFLNWFNFTGGKPGIIGENIESASMLVEQSFSDFGDLDLLIFVEHVSGENSLFFVEAKVSTDTSSWLTVEDRWQEFKQQIQGEVTNTSNLFVQLHRKSRLAAKLISGTDFQVDCLVPRGSTGVNRVVDKACRKLKGYLLDGAQVWNCSVLPDKQSKLDTFASILQGEGEAVKRYLPTWCNAKWGFLSWHTISQEVSSGQWPRTKATLDWNEGQIFRTDSPIKYDIKKNSLALHNGQLVYVIDCGGKNCRVVFLDKPDTGYFWKTTKLSSGELVPSDVDSAVQNQPYLPNSGETYAWDPRDEYPELPEDVPVDGLAKGCRLTVVGNPSWVTTRVRLCNGDTQSDAFRVFTHQLQRT